MQRSKGVAIFGWCEVLLGAIGILPLLETLRMYLLVEYRDATGYYKGWLPGLGDRIGLSILETISASTFPFIFILISGILVLKLKPLGRRLNVLLLPGLLIVEAVYVSLPCEDTHAFGSVPMGVVYVGMALLQIWFFTRPKVREQFENGK